jgi:hypothetical protein
MPFPPDPFPDLLGEPVVLPDQVRVFGFLARKIDQKRLAVNQVDRPFTERSFIIGLSSYRSPPECFSCQRTSVFPFIPCSECPLTDGIGLFVHRMIRQGARF